MTLLPQNESSTLKGLDTVFESASTLDISGVTILPQDARAELLPFIAYQCGVDITGLNEQQSRELLKNFIWAHRYKGTPFAVKKVLDSIVDIDLKEWFEFDGEPFTFSVKLNLSNDIQRLSAITKLIDAMKNARSHYVVDFDYNTNASFYSATAAVSELDFDSSFSLFSMSFIDVFGAQNLTFDVIEHINLKGDSAFAHQSAGIYDYEAFEKEFTIKRDGSFLATPAGIIKIDFGDTGADVMHLPIPPILIKTVVNQATSASFNIDFGLYSDDLWHLNHHLNYEGDTTITTMPLCIIEASFSHLFDTNILALCEFTNANILNLDIGGK